MPVPPELMSASPQTPAGPQGPGGAVSPGQPPIGSSPATQPVANRGLQAAGLAQLQVATNILERVLPMVGAGSEAGKDILGALNKLSKHISPGSISSGVEQSALQNMLMKARQEGPQIAAMKAAAMQHGAPSASPQIPPGLAAQMMQQPAGNA